MDTRRTVCLRIAVCLLLAMFMGACAKPYHLNVTYVLPQAQGVLTKSRVAIKIIDARENTMIFSEKAQKEFDKWDGTFVLVQPEKAQAAQAATSEFTDILNDALKKRLNVMNVDVVNEATDALPVLKLTLKKFFLDLDGRNWVSDFRFDVELSKDGSKTGREEVSAQAERTKVMGKGGGEKLIGEIFSEGINKLNLQKLFENAGF